MPGLPCWRGASDACRRRFSRQFLSCAPWEGLRRTTRSAENYQQISADEDSLLRSTFLFFPLSCLSSRGGSTSVFERLATGVCTSCWLLHSLGLIDEIFFWHPAPFPTPHHASFKPSNQRGGNLHSPSLSERGLSLFCLFCTFKRHKFILLHAHVQRSFPQSLGECFTQRN